MTKDEFLSMIDDELERLNDELRSVDTQVMGSQDPKGKEYQDAQYRRGMLIQRIMNLHVLVDLPAYARIQAMSDAEIEEYKQGKLSELALKVQEVEARDKQEREKLSRLKAEQAQLIEQLGSLYGSERDRAVLRSQQLSEEIVRYEAPDLRSVLVKYDWELRDLRRQQEQVMAMTSQDVKQQLSSNIKNKQRLDSMIGGIPANEFGQLKADVASDPEKARQMADLLARYTRLSQAQDAVKCQMPQGVSIPKSLQDRLMGCYDFVTGEVRNPDQFMKIVEEYEGSFQYAKETFMEQCTEEKLSQLVGKMETGDVEVDMDFLQQHADKLGNGDLTFLQSLVEQRNLLSKKIIKTKSTKESIENLTNQIKLGQSNLCKQIIGWYQSQSSALLGISGLSFVNLEYLRQSLEKCQEQIGASERTISTIKEEFQKAKERMEQQKNNYEMGKQEVAQQIRGLGGEKYRDTPIDRLPLGAYDVPDRETALKNIAETSDQVYLNNIVHSVQQEAQNQADTREAELRNMNLEQLLQMRQQVQAMADGPLMMDAVSTEVSHGVKR